MGNADGRQDPPVNNGVVISGGNNYVVSQAAGHAQAFIDRVSNQPQDAELLAELLLHVEQLLEQYYPALADPGTPARDLLRRLREELEEAEPRPAVLWRILDWLNQYVQPVTPLVVAVGQLAESVHNLLRTSGKGSEPTQPPLPVSPSEPPAEDSLEMDEPASRTAEPEVAPLPITIFLADEAPHRDVQAAVEELLATAGLEVLDREDPVVGSWFRRMRATVSRAARSQVVRESALTAAHIADARLILAQDATITATMMTNVGPVLTALQPTKDAVVRIGAVLIVKVDWEVRVLQLTAAQQAILDHQPHLATSPRDVIGAIGLLAASDGRTAPEPAPQTAVDR
ncbi:hypothetical protein [Streptomyces coerulescens]|uniref:Uncharacterized protein n=1 Tax=Streptomyces coerulescens TaxID=29304 RepID=A0ABW0D117_STRCD